MRKTEENILKAAIKLFSEDGYNGVSTKRIAKEAGVNEITIFRHFNTKSELLQAVIRDFAFEGNIIEKISQDITGNLREDLYIFTEVYYMFLENNIKMYKIQLKEISEEGEKFTNSVEYVKFMKAYLQREVDKGNFNGDPQMIASGIVSMILGVFTFKVYNPDIFQEVTHRSIMKRFVDDIIRLYCND